MGQQKGKKKKKGRRQRSSSSGSISPQKADTRRQHNSSSFGGSISPQKADKKIISPTNAVAAPAANLAFEKRLRFGNVRILHFERCLGTQVVPRDGGWPLGLSRKASSSSSDNEECTIDAFEKQKQSKLRERWNDLDPKTKKELEGMPSLKADSPVGQVFETRQWDFKRIKNPLS